MVTILSVGLHAAETGMEHERTSAAVEVHGAGAALRDAAAVLGARQADLLANDPQQRRVGFHLHVTDPAVDVQLCHGLPPGRSASGHTLTDRRRCAKDEVAAAAREASPGCYSVALMTACAQCRFENPVGMRFCGQCGAPLAPHCPQCGAEVPAGFRFCGHCGASLAAPAPRRRPRRPRRGRDPRPPTPPSTWRRRSSATARRSRASAAR